MALGSRKEEQQPSLWVTHDALPHSKGHAFHGKLNPLLREAGFDRYVETLCEPHYHGSDITALPRQEYPNGPLPCFHARGWLIMKTKL